MAITVNILCGMTIRKDLTNGVANATGTSIQLSVGGTRKRSGSSIPDVELAAAPEIALVAGAKTIDLTAVPDVNGGTVDGTGKKPRAIYFGNPADNTADMTFAKGASNGADALSGAWSITLRPDEEFCVPIADTGPSVISGTNKTIDVTGTGTESFDFGIAFG